MAMTKEKREKLSTEAVMDKVIEESAELIQAVCKLKNFGPRPLFEGVQYDNVRDVVTEYKQLRGIHGCACEADNAPTCQPPGR
jgi:hypothetical protein